LEELKKILYRKKEEQDWRRDEIKSNYLNFIKCDDCSIDKWVKVCWDPYEEELYLSKNEFMS